MHIARTIGIWVSGLVGFGTAGGILGQLADHGSDGFGLGWTAGFCIFACARLWFSKPQH